MAFEVKTPFFSFFRRAQTEIILEPGQNIMVLEWSWKRFGYKRKIIQIDTDGDIHVTYV